MKKIKLAGSVLLVGLIMVFVGWKVNNAINEHEAELVAKTKDDVYAQIVYDCWIKNGFEYNELTFLCQPIIPAN
jgi:hypothetical protein